MQGSGSTAKNNLCFYCVWKVLKSVDDNRYSSCGAWHLVWACYTQCVPTTLSQMDWLNGIYDSAKNNAKIDSHRKSSSFHEVFLKMLSHGVFTSIVVINFGECTNRQKEAEMKMSSGSNPCKYSWQAMHLNWWEDRKVWEVLAGGLPLIKCLVIIYDIPLSR